MRLVPAAAVVVACFATFQEPDDPTPQAPVVGAPAPAFRLNDHEGTARAVGGESEDWTAVAFYPKAMTPG